MDFTNIINEVINRNGLPGKFLSGTTTPRNEVMFLAEMPTNKISKNSDVHENFNATIRDEFFLNTLTEYNLHGVYVTDIVKRRDTPRRPSENEIVEWRDILIKEINAIKPKLLIVIGKGNYFDNYLPYIKDYIPYTICDDWIFHYCSRVSRSKFKKRFSEVYEKHKDKFYSI